MKSRLLPLFVFILFFCCFSTTSFAHSKASTEEAPPYLYSVSLEELIQIVGLTSKVSRDEQGKPILYESIGQYTFHIRSVDNNQLLVFSYTLNCPKEVSSIKINDWNRFQLGSRAYLNHKKQPVLLADLNLRQGVTKEAVDHFYLNSIFTIEAFNQKTCP